MVAGALIAFVATAFDGLHGSNLVANPGFEDHYIDAAAVYNPDPNTVQFDLQTDNTTNRGVQPWQHSSGDVPGIRTDGPASGAAGDWFGMGGRDDQAPSSAMSQTIDLIEVGFLESELDNSTLVLSAGGWLNSWPGDADTVELTVTVLDDQLSTLATGLATGPRNDDVWTLYSATTPLPVGARHIQVRTDFERLSGSNSDGRVDEVWVTLTPSVTPAPMLDRNLLANPTFENGTGAWQVRSGNVRCRMTGIDGVIAHSGQKLLFGGQRELAPGDQALASQRVDLVTHGFTPAQLDSPGLFVRAEGRLSSYASPDSHAQAQFTVTVLDGFETPLLHFESSRLLSDVPRPRRFEAELPIGARSIIFEFDALDRSGTNLDGYLDDASLMITQQPHGTTLGGPVAVAHRGNSSVAPENTCAAIQAAGAFALIEVDARRCQTGELVVIHDRTVERTTDGSGDVAAMSLAQLQALDAGSWFSPEFVGEPLPSLAQAIGAVPADSRLLIERKTGAASDYVALIQQLNAHDRVLLMSDSWSTFLTQVHAADPGIRLVALGKDPVLPGDLAMILASGASAVSWRDSDLTDPDIAAFRAAGLDIFVWTLNDPSTIADAIARDVDGITTDHPHEVAWQSIPCAAEFNNDGVLNTQDLVAFLNAFVANDPVVDLNDDGVINTADFVEFLNLFAAGCN